MEKCRQAGLDWQIDSAGTNSYHTGEAPHQLSRKVASLNGIDISNQRARRFIPEDMQRFDRIYAMAADVVDDMQAIAKADFDKQKVDLLLNELYPGENQDVPDPWYGPEAGYHEVFELISRACDCIIKNR